MNAEVQELRRIAEAQDAYGKWNTAPAWNRSESRSDAAGTGRVGYWPCGCSERPCAAQLWSDDLPHAERNTVMCELCDKKDEIAQAVRRVQRIQDKVTLANSKFADAAKDRDQGLMDDARLEIHTHYDSLLDLTADVYRLNEEYKDMLLEGPPDGSSGPLFH